MRYDTEKMSGRELREKYPFVAEYEPVLEVQGAGNHRWVCWQNRDDLSIIAVCVNGSTDVVVIDEGWTYPAALRKVYDLIMDELEEGVYFRPATAHRKNY